MLPHLIFLLFLKHKGIIKKILNFIVFVQEIIYVRKRRTHVINFDRYKSL